MKTSLKCSIIAAALVAASGVAMAAPVTPYVTNSTSATVMNPYGLCWRTGFWTPALAEQAGVEGAGCACDNDNNQKYFEDNNFDFIEYLCPF